MYCIYIVVHIVITVEPDFWEAVSLSSSLVPTVRSTGMLISNTWVGMELAGPHGHPVSRLVLFSPPLFLLLSTVACQCGGPVLRVHVMSLGLWPYLRTQPLGQMLRSVASVQLGGTHRCLSVAHGCRFIPRHWLCCVVLPFWKVTCVCSHSFPCWHL